MIYGRKSELASLKRLLSKKTASLVTVTGRRRIGKSYLIENFGQSAGKFIVIQGLGPDQKADEKDQLIHFSDSVSEQFNTKKIIYETWNDALMDLAKKTSKGRHTILLDEVSWMASGFPLFPAYLKNAWDMYFKKNNQLILILCGSVSAWIEDNILKSKTFLGRVSLSLNVQELELPQLNKFWSAEKSRLSSFEKVLLLSITGGVPKYLEEIVLNEDIDKNLIELCFKPEGLLFNEFENIFNDIFSRKSKALEKIVRLCLTQRLSPIELSRKLGKSYNSELSEYIHILKNSGFLSQEYYYKFDGQMSKLSHLRVKDNYLRFYLKYIEPNKHKIESKQKVYSSFSDLKGFEQILGFQFENLILSNKDLVFQRLGLLQNQIISAAPYIQKVNSKIKNACQIDLLIHSNLDVFYLCEMKCKKMIDHSIIKEVEKKMSSLKLPKKSGLKPILIYEGELYPPHKTEIENYFFKTVYFGDLLKE